jgi:hypothetical protein
MNGELEEAAVAIIQVKLTGPRNMHGRPSYASVSSMLKSVNKNYADGHA